MITVEQTKIKKKEDGNCHFFKKKQLRKLIEQEVFYVFYLRLATIRNTLRTDPKTGLNEFTRFSETFGAPVEMARSGSSSRTVTTSRRPTANTAGPTSPRTRRRMETMPLMEVGQLSFWYLFSGFCSVTISIIFTLMSIASPV